jgi:PGAP1-like protein
VALQPSLGHFFSHVNGEWKKGYNTDKSHGIFSSAGTRLSNVIVVSIAGGVHDYQVFLISMSSLCSIALQFHVSHTLFFLDVEFLDLFEP